MQKQEQIEANEKKEIEVKLDEILKRLDALSSKLEEEIYPNENSFKKSYVKKEEQLDKKIKSGKLKLHNYRNIEEMDKALG